MPANGFNITNAYEFIIVFGDKALKSNYTYTKNHIETSVNSKMPKNHKAVMSLDLAEWIIRTFTNRGDLVLDCFMGVGTTGIACKKNNRDFIGFEKSEEYTKDANRNIEAGEVLR